MRELLEDDEGFEIAGHVAEFDPTGRELLSIKTDPEYPGPTFFVPGVTPPPLPPSSCLV